MSNKKDFFTIRADFEKSLKDYIHNNLALKTAVTTAITLMDAGADPKRCLDTLREYVGKGE